jgi:hypothetical protein
MWAKQGQPSVSLSERPAEMRAEIPHPSPGTGHGEHNLDLYAELPAGPDVRLDRVVEYTHLSIDRKFAEEGEFTGACARSSADCCPCTVVDGSSNRRESPRTDLPSICFSQDSNIECGSIGGSTGGTAFSPSPSQTYPDPFPTSKPPPVPRRRKSVQSAIPSGRTLVGVGPAA